MPLLCLESSSTSGPESSGQPTGDLELLLGEPAEGVEREPGAFVGPVEARGTADLAQAKGLLVEPCSQRVAVAAVRRLADQAGIGEDGDSGGVAKVAVIGFEEGVDLTARLAQGGKVGVDGIDDEDYGDRRVVAREGLKRGDGARRFVIQQGEGGRRDVRHRVLRLMGRNNVERDGMGGSLGRSLRGSSGRSCGEVPGRLALGGQTEGAGEQSGGDCGEK
jgi:hypothetical protein